MYINIFYQTYDLYQLIQNQNKYPYKGKKMEVSIFPFILILYLSNILIYLLFKTFYIQIIFQTECRVMNTLTCCRRQGWYNCS